MLINQALLASIGSAIETTQKAVVEVAGKWDATAPMVRKEWPTREGFVAVRAGFIEHYIYPMMGKDSETGLAWTVVMQDLPRKDSKAYKLAAQESGNPAKYEETHATLRARQKIGRSMGGEYCTRIEVATFGKPEKPESDAKTPETKQAKLLKKAAELLAAIQADEEPTYDHKTAIASMQKVVRALTI